MPSATDPARPGPPGLIWPLIPAVVAALVFANTLSGDFALDDIPLVRDNPRIHSLSGLPSLFVQPYWPGDAAAGLYRPLTTASFALNRALTGPGASGFHAGNVLLHGLVCFFAWYALRRAGRYYGTALAGALLFAVHPLHTEAVANIAGRAELLAALFVLVAWLSHRRAFEAGPTAGGLRWSAAAGVAYLAALLSKEGAILAPLFFLFDDLLRRRDGVPATTIARSPYPAYVVSGFVALALRVAALGGFRGAESAIFLDNPPAFAGTFERIGTALWVQVKFLGLFVFPARLSSDYSHDGIPMVESLSDPRLWIGALWILTLVGMLIVGWKRSRPLALGVAIWILFFLPSANLLFPSGTVMAERLAYLPSLGASLILANRCAWLGSPTASPLRSFGRARQVTPVLLVAVVVAALFARSWARNPQWADNRTLALHDVETLPRSAKLQAGAAIVLHGEGRRAEAEAAYRRALEIYPDYAQMHFNLGRLLLDAGDGAGAVEHLGQASRLSPSNPRPYKSLAPLLESLGRRDEALAAYEAGARLDPGDSGFRFNQGRALLAAGRLPEAEQVLAALGREHPEAVPGQLGLALLAETQGERERAAAIYRALLDRGDLAPGVRANIHARLAELD